MNDDEPIEISGLALPTALAAGLRYALTSILAFAVGRGWVDTENADGILSIILLLVTVGYGLWKTYRKQSQLITAGEAAPNSVAVVKP